MTDLGAQLAGAQRAYREALLPLLKAPWRTGRSHEGNLWARTGAAADWKDDFPFAAARTGELAAEIVASHNALLDLAAIADAGFSAELSRHEGGVWRVEVCPGPYGKRLACGHGRSPGEALAEARQWADERAAT